VRAYNALDDVLSGAAVVVLLVRVGALSARDHDERFPARFGLIGDEGVGVGGMANAWRTLPVLGEIAARIAACAPGARVLNMMAPLGVTTRLLIERGHRAIGLCELPTVTLARWTAAAGPSTAPALQYAGLNHLGFFWSTAGPALEHPVLRAAIAARDATPELVAHYDAAPLHYFVDVFEPAAAHALGRPPRTGRARVLADHGAVLVKRFAEEPGAPVAELDRRPTPWFEQALAPALHAAIGGPPFVGPLDLPNAGRLTEAPAEAIVELYGRVTAEAATLDPVPPRPPAVAAMLGRLAVAEDLLYRAARDRDRGLLGASLDALPVAVRRGDRDRVLDGVCEPIDQELAS
jgi:6-phospho-beta-glucosidase